MKIDNLFIWENRTYYFVSCFMLLSVIFGLALRELTFDYTIFTPLLMIYASFQIGLMYKLQKKEIIAAQGFSKTISGKKINIIFLSLLAISIIAYIIRIILLFLS